MATEYKRARTFGGAATRDRSERTSLGPLRQRFIKSLRGPEQDDQRTIESVPPPALSAERDMDDILPRFPIVRQGYDCRAVDAYIDELERDLAEADRELAEVRGHAAPADEVQSELKRIGEQTSAVLIAAHEQSDEILRAAREQAERSTSEAAARASSLISDGEARLREIQAQKEETHRERDRLLDDVRAVSTALAALVDSAHERVAPQG